MYIQTILKNHSGFTLIEIMVTMVVMSIGFLGLAGLQATALRSNSGASLQTVAVIYANDMAERIRANPSAVTNNQFLNVDSTATIDCAAFPPTICEEFYDEGGNVVTPATNCNVNDMAAFDINTWFCGGIRDGGNPNVRSPGLNPLDPNAILPMASATITCDDSDATSGTPDLDPCSPNSVHTITVNWRTRKEQGSDFDALDGAGNCINAGDASTDCHSVSLAIQP
ncbi:MAG: type IV pilus modification protein PilV [Gammaproteobacteria bacterium]|nr:type IV pilus modification protein PilV [Gammaproteobacteria bacterium]